MALPPLVTVDQLANSAGFEPSSLAAIDLGRAEEALADASALVRLIAGRTWVQDGVLTEVPDAVITITRAAALRRYENPRGIGSETIGAYSYTLPGADATSGAVYLTESERADLRSATSTRRGLRTITVTREDPLDLIGYVSVVGTTSLFPWYADDVNL